MVTKTLLLIILVGLALASKRVFSDKIFAGEVHYSRIPVEYWPHRVETIKAMGMNALSVYVMWNYHEVEPGVFDWETENRNLSKFLEVAQDYNMTVLIRPGPYVCAQWDLGGIPAWLLKEGTAQLRTNTPTFMNLTRKYFASIAPIINQYDNAKTGGPIKLLQIQNEYGSFGSDLSYINALRDIWSSLNVTVEQYHADTSSSISKSHWQGGNIGVNAANSENNYAAAKAIDPYVFIFGGEIYPGWMTHWGEPWASQSTAQSLNVFGFQVKYNHSFSMYMAHGGTNFGFTAGANQGTGLSDYTGHVTSYDYDAPIDEQGSTGEKYTALRNLLKQYASWEVPQPPAPIKTVKIPAFTPILYATLIDNLPEGIDTTNFTFFESDTLKMYNQGIVVYTAEISKGNYTFNATFRDYAIVFVNKTPIHSYYRGVNKLNVVNITCPYPICSLEIMVEAMGHINFGLLINNDIKGLINLTEVKGGKLYKMKMHKMPLDYASIKAMDKITFGNWPALGRYTFDLNEVGDTFLNMENFTKGYVWVNGRNLGRFWSLLGPQKKLFCPGVWLKEKNNEIIVMDMGDKGMRPITGDQNLKSFDDISVLQQSMIC